MSKNPITTPHKIGKITYLVAASSSDTATDTLKKKIEKVIMKDLINTGNTRVVTNSSKRIISNSSANSSK